MSAEIESALEEIPQSDAAALWKTAKGDRDTFDQLCASYRFASKSWGDGDDVLRFVQKSYKRQRRKRRQKLVVEGFFQGVAVFMIGLFVWAGVAGIASVIPGPWDVLDEHRSVKTFVLVDAGIGIGYFIAHLAHGPFGKKP